MNGGRRKDHPIHTQKIATGFLNLMIHKKKWAPVLSEERCIKVSFREEPTMISFV